MLAMIEMLTRRGAEAIPALEAAAESTDTRIRTAAIGALKRLWMVPEDALV